MNVLFGIKNIEHQNFEPISMFKNTLEDKKTSYPVFLPNSAI